MQIILQSYNCQNKKIQPNKPNNNNIVFTVMQPQQPSLTLPKLKLQQPHHLPNISSIHHHSNSSSNMPTNKNRSSQSHAIGGSNSNSNTVTNIHTNANVNTKINKNGKSRASQEYLSAMQVLNQYKSQNPTNSSNKHLKTQIQQMYGVPHSQILRNELQLQPVSSQSQKQTQQSRITKALLSKQSRSKSSSNDIDFTHLQYKYISKSPQYFKKKERSLHTLEPLLETSRDKDSRRDNRDKGDKERKYSQEKRPERDLDDVPVETYIGDKIRKFNKDSLINLAKQGLYKNVISTYKHRVIPKKKKYSGANPNSQAENSHGENSGSNFIYGDHYSPSFEAKKQFQTKYSSFNPTRIGPLMHSLQKVLPSTFAKKI